jgi:DNA-3-methyladenine glycosylase II
MRPPRFAEWFETFVNVVPFQQLSLEAGLAIVGRLVERFGEQLEQSGRRFHAPPTARAVAVARLEALRKCGLSSRKAESLRYLARAIESGELAEDKISGMKTDDALRALVELPGIGPWSASLVLLRGLGRLDVFPPGDVGAARGLGALMHLRPGASLTRRVERLGAYRGYLYFYALGGSLLDRDDGRSRARMGRAGCAGDPDNSAPRETLERMSCALVFVGGLQRVCDRKLHPTAIRVVTRRVPLPPHLGSSGE